MNQYVPYPQNFQQMHGLLQNQHQTIEDLKKKLSQLQDDLAALQQEPRTVEYNFDQLKIERLEGTLNIGLSPGQSKGSLDDLSIDGNPVQSSSDPAVDPGLLQSVQNGVNQYMNNDAWNDLVQIENNQQYPLDHPYRQFIMQDIQKQIEPRIRHYFKKYSSEGKGTDPETADHIINHVKNDVFIGMENFVSKLKQGSESS